MFCNIMEEPTVNSPREGFSSSSAYHDDQRAMTSMRVFREFIKRSRNKDGSDMIDATGVISRECYDLWVKTRKQLPPNPEKAFQRSLSAHVTGVDGRVPFTPSEEAAVLKILRRKERWPCFEQSATRFGLMGFRAKGFHEKSSEMNEPMDQRKRFRHDDDDDGSDEESASSPASTYRALPTTMSMMPGMMKPPAAAYPMMMMPNMPKIDDFSFKPQLHVEPPKEPQGEFSFLETAHALLSRFYVSGIDAWSTVLSLARMSLMSKGWGAPPTIEEGTKMLEIYMAKYPSSHIIVMDPATRHLRDRILALSPSAQGFLGPVARNQNGLDRRLVPLSDAWAALSTAFAANKTPGIEQSVILNILCKDGVLRPANCFFSMHPEQRVLVLRAIPVQH